ncbi:MAG: hypothetical protein ACOYMA_09600 [Bacteroidia bacterium]
MRKLFYLFLCLMFAGQLFAQYGQRFSALNSYKVIIGAGTGIYWGSGRLYSLPKTSNPNEITAAFSAGFFKTYSDKFELGLRYNHADLKGQRFGKSWGNTTMFKTTLDDISIQSNISLNNNLFLRDQFYTINLITGLGAAYYSATMTYVNPYQIRSSVGIGRSELNNIPDKQFAFFGTIGIGFHVRLNQLLSVGIDNFVNITHTKNLTGIVNTENTKMIDSYSIHVLTIGLRLGKGNKLFCARL